MRTDDDLYGQYMVAAELHMTVAELRQRMSSAEFTNWLAYFAERARREANALKRARRR